MRVVLQRVSSAGVTVNGGENRTVGRGLVLLAGFTHEDTPEIAKYVAEKAVNLRIFDDEDGNLNRSLLDVGGEALVVSNFTLYGNCRKGRRPSFISAAKADQAKRLYEYFVGCVEEAGASKVACGEFQAEMLVDIQNDGPVTLILDSDQLILVKDNM